MENVRLGNSKIREVPSQKELVKSMTIGRWYVAIVKENFEMEPNSFSDLVIKFYDTKFVFGKDYADNVNPMGYQFTSGSYYCHSIMAHDTDLNFYGDVPEWTISYKDLLIVKEFIRQYRNAK